MISTFVLCWKMSLMLSLYQASFLTGVNVNLIYYYISLFMNQLMHHHQDTLFYENNQVGEKYCQ